MEEITICIVTYNRLEYLKRCLWSLIATTKGNYRILVVDDGSDDGTIEFLESMQQRELIEYWTNEKNMGTAWNFNFLIKKVKTEKFVMANDDMYFYRWWDRECLNVFKKFKDCGIVTFFDYTRYSLDDGVKKINSQLLKVPRTGLGASMMKKSIFDKVGGFALPKGKIMGFLATPFCVQANKHCSHYALINPFYAHHMDLRNSKMCERDNMGEYIKHREKHKHGK